MGQEENDMPFFRKKTVIPALKYDPARQEPAVRKSICTGEMTVGFIDKDTGKFHDLVMVDHQGLEEFRRQAGVETLKEIY